MKQDYLWESDIISLLLSYIVLKTWVIISLFMFLLVVFTYEKKICSIWLKKYFPDKILWRHI